MLFGQSSDYFSLRFFCLKVNLCVFVCAAIGVFVLFCSWIKGINLLENKHIYQMGLSNIVRQNIETNETQANLSKES